MMMQRTLSINTVKPTSCHQPRVASEHFNRGSCDGRRRRRGTGRVGPSESAAPWYEGDLSLPLGLALGSPIFPLGCEGKLGVALESLHAWHSGEMLVEIKKLI